MKDFLTILALLGLTVALWFIPATESKSTPSTFIDTYYPECGVVTSVILPEGNEPWNSEVTFETMNGNIFSFYGGEDLEVGDVIAVIFDDKGTPEVMDDAVVSVRYCSPINVDIIE